MRQVVEEAKQLSASQIFGKLCVDLRQHGEIVLLSLINSITRYDLKGDTLVLVVANDAQYNSLAKPSHKSLVEQLTGCKVMVEKATRQQVQSIEEYLKEKIEGLIIKE